MEIYLDLLSKDDYLEILKHIEHSIISKPFVSDNKLNRKYIKGFRVSNAPLFMLNGAYFSEIKNGNISLKEYFIKIVDKYLSEKKLDNFAEEIKSLSNVHDAFNKGVELAEKRLDIDLDLVLKLLKIDLDENSKTIINNSFIKNRELMRKYESKIEEVDKRLALSNKDIEKKDKDCAALKELTQKLEDENKQLKQSNNELRESIFEKDGEIKAQKLELIEINCEHERMLNRIDTTEKTISSLIVEKTSIEEKVHEAQVQNDALEKEIVVLKSKKIIEYETAIADIVKETINELKEKFEITEEDFNNILSQIDQPHTIGKVWRAISNNNQEIIDNVEVAMKKETIDISVIDLCDEIENMVLVKYMIIKALKAAIFEHFSHKECKWKIYDRF